MWSAIATIALALSLSDGVPPLESRPLSGAPTVVPDIQAINFDLYDVRSEPPEAVVNETTPHSVFRLRRHLGMAGGYDQGVLHGSVGLYVTVAEMGRWNIGMTSPGIGLSRYHVSDARHHGSFAKTDLTILVSLASVHYRGGYLQSIDKLWYVNFEQVFDTRTNVAGSQIGISFSGR